MRVGVVGLGRLGFPYAVTLADAGHEVSVWDQDGAVRDSFEARRGWLDEPGVLDMWLRCCGRLMIERPDQMMTTCRIVFIVVPTPSEHGVFSSRHVEDVIKNLGPRDKNEPIVAVVSTLQPGTCGQVLEPLVGPLACPLVYCPSLIALGSVIRDLQLAEVQILGSDDQAAMEEVADVLLRVAPRTPMHYMGFESAEIAKLASNVFATVKIAFANQLGQIAQSFRADVEDIIDALAEQKMIGPKMLTPGAGFGGPCLPRDGVAYSIAGGSLGAVVHAMNREHLGFVAQLCVRPGLETVHILGRAYKSGTTHRDESFGDALADLFQRTRVLFPVAMAEADVVVIALPVEEHDLRGAFKPGARVIDLWRAHRYLAHEDLDYVPFGSS